MQKDLHIIYEQLFLERNTACNISAFISGTEHSGVSWCALTLAHTLSLHKKKALLVDAHGNLSNINSYISLDNPAYMENYIRGENTINQLVNKYKSNYFDILVGFSGNNYLENYPQGRIQVLSEDLRILSQNYSHTFIDIGSDVCENNLSLCQIANHLFIVCSEQSTDLVKTIDLIRFIYQSNISATCYLIINRVNSFEDGFKIYKELYKAFERIGLTAPLLFGIIRFDARIRDTIKNKELLLTRYPSSEAAIDINSILKKLNME